VQGREGKQGTLIDSITNTFLNRYIFSTQKYAQILDAEKVEQKEEGVETLPYLELFLYPERSLVPIDDYRCGEFESFLTD
jgi:hypothetical protein